jgi:hypothetical protein
MNESHLNPQFSGMMRLVEFAVWVFQNSTFQPGNWEQASSRSSSWHEKNPGTTSIIHAELIAPTPQAGCSHYKSRSAQRAPTSPPSPRRDENRAVASHQADHGRHQRQGLHWLHAADAYKREHIGPVIVPPSWPPQPLNLGILGPLPDAHLRKNVGATTLATFSSSYDLPSRAAEQHGLGALATQWEKAPTDARHAMGWDPAAAIICTVFASGGGDGRRWMREWRQVGFSPSRSPGSDARLGVFPVLPKLVLMCSIKFILYCLNFESLLKLCVCKIYFCSIILKWQRHRKWKKKVHFSYSYGCGLGLPTTMVTMCLDLHTYPKRARFAKIWTQFWEHHCPLGMPSAVFCS